jgi:hypothetical protein
MAHTQPQYYVEDNVQFHASAILIDGTESKVRRIEQTAVWAPESGWAMWIENNFPLQGYYPN